MYLFAGLAAIGLYFLLPWNSAGQSLLYDLIGISSAVAVFARTRQHRPPLPRGWSLFAALLAALAVLALTPAWRTVSYRYLSASIVVLLVVDEIYGITPASFPATSWLDAGWLLSYILWGVAALTPSMRDLSQPTASSAGRLSAPRLFRSEEH